MRMLIGFELAVIVAAALTFVVRYAMVPGWTRTPAGRIMMALTSAVLVFFTLLGSLLFDVAVPVIFWVISLAVLDTVMCAQVLLLFWLQKGNGNARAGRESRRARR